MPEASAPKEYIDALMACTPDELQRVQASVLRLVSPLEAFAMPSIEEFYANDPEALQAYYDASEAAYERTRMTLG